jgi:NADPH:quinone reductase-like Zn-dependent oxidoreductase
LRLRAAALNSRDPQVVLGIYPSSSRPVVPLMDGVGEVEAVGRSVSRARVGDRVCVLGAPWLAGPWSPDVWVATLGAEADGTAQERLTIHEDQVVQAPAHLSDEEAASLPAAGGTAWHAIVELGRVKPGDNVLVQGTGGVAMFALQFAKLAGARAIVTSRSAVKLEKARAAGADDVVDTTAVGDWSASVRELTGGAGVDHVIDLTGELERDLQCLRVGGVVTQVGYMSSLRLSADVIPLMLSNVRLYGIVSASRAMVEDMNRAIAFHRLRPVIDRVFAFDELPAAYAYMAAGEYSGKIVVRF